LQGTSGQEFHRASGVNPFRKIKPIQVKTNEI